MAMRLPSRAVTPITPGGAHLSHIDVRNVNMELPFRSVRSLRPHHLEVPIPRRYSPRQRGFAEGMARHAAAVRDGSASYCDPVTGFTVFTAQFLADRGY